jgi:hypothetical protein
MQTPLLLGHHHHRLTTTNVTQPLSFLSRPHMSLIRWRAAGFAFLHQQRVKRRRWKWCGSMCIG